MILAALLLAPVAVGLPVGADASAFEPRHVTGPYAGQTMCPVCEWGLRPLVFVFTRDARPLGPLYAAIAAEVRGTKTKAVVVDVNESADDAATAARLAGVKMPPEVYLTFRQAAKRASLRDWAVPLELKWTTVVYTVRDRKVVGTWVDPKEVREIRSAVGGRW